MVVADMTARVRLASPTSDPGDELPLRILVLADLAGRRLPAPLDERQPRTAPADGLDALMAALAPRLVLRVPDRLSATDGGALTISVAPRRLADFTPAALAAQVPCLAEGAARHAALLSRRDDVATALLRERLDGQLAAILAAPELRALEAAWRGLALLAGHAGPGTGVEVAVLPATRAEIEEDLADAPDQASSGLHRRLYAAEYGQHGGRPWGAVLLDAAIGPGPRDLALLRRLAAVCAHAHAPLLADAAPALLGLAGWEGLDHLDDVPAALAATMGPAWTAFRAAPASRHAVLALPGIALRPPQIPGDGWLWGGAAWALAARLADCHADRRWCVHAAGGVEAEVALPRPPPGAALGAAETRPPVAALVTEVPAQALGAAGLAVLCASRLRPRGCFPALPTLHAAGGAAAQLPLVLVADRIAHHLKVLHRERLGGAMSAAEVERELADWLGGHCADGDGGDPALRALRPLRGASVRVRSEPGRAGWLRIDLAIRPWLPEAGADVALDLVGRLDRGT